MADQFPVEVQITLDKLWSVERARIRREVEPVLQEMRDLASCIDRPGWIQSWVERIEEVLGDG